MEEKTPSRCLKNYGGPHRWGYHSESNSQFYGRCELCGAPDPLRDEDEDFDAGGTDLIRISIRQVYDPPFKVIVSKNATLADVMNEIEKVQSIPVHRQRLILQGKQYQADRTCEDLGLVNGSYIDMRLTLGGRLPGH